LSGDTHISGWMVGKQPSGCEDFALTKETEACESFSPWIDGLSRLNANSSRRAPRAFTNHFEAKQIDAQARFSFSLPKGCYATSWLREFVEGDDIANNRSLGIRVDG